MFDRLQLYIGAALVALVEILTIATRAAGY